MPNLELLDKIIDIGENYPQHLYMSMWAFTLTKDVESYDPATLPDGTTLCVAAWAAVLNGERLDWQPEYDVEFEGYCAYRVVDKLDGTQGDYISSLGRKYLGLEEDQAAYLFGCCLNLDDIRSMRDTLAEQ